MLTYDAVSFMKYLDTIVTAHSPPPGSSRHNYSPWLFLDAAHILFQTAKSRVYQGKISNDTPSTLQPVLEAQPKWDVLAEVLEEIDTDAYLNPANVEESNSTVLIMCSDQRTCRQIREYLGTMHAGVDTAKAEDDEDDEEGNKDRRGFGNVIMRRRLREYLNWKNSLSNVNKNLSARPENDESQAGKASDSPAPSNQQQGRAPPNKRRRVRGGDRWGVVRYTPVQRRERVRVVGSERCSRQVVPAEVGAVERAAALVQPWGARMGRMGGRACRRGVA